MLDSDEIAKLLAAAWSPRDRALYAVAVFAGLRQGEALGLRRSDVDVAGGVLHVRRQWTRKGAAAYPKTGAGRREVPIMPALGKLLAEHLLASGAAAEAPLFATVEGRPLDHRAVLRSFKATVQRAGLSAELVFHDLRDSCASLLIANGEDVVYVARVMGHSSTRETLDTYAHLFDRRERAEKARAAMEARYGTVLEPFTRTEQHPAALAAAGDGAEVVELSQVRT